MNTEQRERLRKHRMALSSGIDDNTELVLTRLVQAKILTVVDKEIILSQKTSIKRNEKTLDLLPKRGPAAFNEFVKVLNDVELTSLATLITSSEEQKETGFDTLDGRPAPTSVITEGDESISPVDKHPKLDHDNSIDITDTPPSGIEQEDGRFLGGKKKETSHSSMEVDSLHPGNITFSPEDCYPMNTAPRGRLLLVNNKDFQPESGMAPYTRNGTDEDAKAIKSLFEELGFIVEEHRNISVYDIRKVFKRAGTMDYSKYSASAACVLSHGQEGIIYGTDGTIDIKEITGFFRGRNLAGKPKMFFFQACQGSEYMDAVEPAVTGDETDGPVEYGNDISLPTESDFLYAYSTVPGYYSWRNSTKGSWFIQAICEVFRQYAHKMDVVRMLTRVNQIVATKKSQTGQRASHHKRQISSVISQLRKEIYLFPPHGPLKRSSSADY